MDRQMMAVFLMGRISLQMAPGVDWELYTVKESGKEVRFEPQYAHGGVTLDGRPIWNAPKDKDGHLCPTITISDGEVTVEHHIDDGDEAWYHERSWAERFQYYGYCM